MVQGVSITWNFHCSAVKTARPSWNGQLELEQWPEIELLSSIKSGFFPEIAVSNCSVAFATSQRFWWSPLVTGRGFLFMILVLSFRRWGHTAWNKHFLFLSPDEIWNHRKTVIHNHPDNYLDFSLCKGNSVLPFAPQEEQLGNRSDRDCPCSDYQIFWLQHSMGQTIKVAGHPLKMV